METESIRIKTFFTIIASVALIEGTAIFLFWSRDVNPLLITAVVRVLETLTIITAVLTGEKGLSAIGLGISTIAFGFKRGLIWSAAFGLITGLVFLILYFTGINPLTLLHTRIPEHQNELLLFVLTGCIIGPVAEEIFFRGILYGFFRRWGIIAALLLTTVIFLLAHQNFRTIPVTQAAGGMIFAVAYEIEKSLMVPIIIHILGNAAIFTLPLFLK